MLYLRADLCKGAQQTSEVRGGKYVARVKIGVEKDGSPMYRYFKTQEEYDSYLQGKGSKKKGPEKDKQGEALASKVAKEHKESKKKMKENLLVGGSSKAKKKHKVEETKKSLLYIKVS